MIIEGSRNVKQEENCRIEMKRTEENITEGNDEREELREMGG